jgi:hypothetical protein
LFGVDATMNGEVRQHHPLSHGYNIGNTPAQSLRHSGGDPDSPFRNSCIGKDSIHPARKKKRDLSSRREAVLARRCHMLDRRALFPIPSRATNYWKSLRWKVEI